ncbi:MAG: PorV/PorQ family protein [Ignavibacteriae bacterium]|nr:PorV/PorQ family protein [Ignavibacteriota bacterium]
MIRTTRFQNQGGTMKPLILVLCGLLICSVPVHAGRGDKSGTSAAAELLIPIGPRGIALGGSSLATVTGIEAVYWNPAGLAQSLHAAYAMFSHMDYIADIGVEYGAVGISFAGFGTLALSLKTLSFGDIEITTEDQPDGTGELTSPTFFTLGTTYARQLADRIAVGLTFNLISERMERVSSTGIAFNIGVQYSGVGGISGLDLGVVVKNIGPQMKYSGPGLLRQGNIDDVLRPGSFYLVKAASAELPSIMELGLGYRTTLAEGSKLITTAMFQNNNFSEDEYKTGIEYVYNDMLFLRGGYNIVSTQSSDRESIFDGAHGWTFGFGFHRLVSDVDVNVDYAYRAVEFFGGNHVFGVTFGF